jgi:hypothetical protein
MPDDTEYVRRALVDALNSNPDERAELMARYGEVWSTEQLRADFEVVGFMAPLVVVVRKATGEKGTLMFQHEPRFYFAFQAD